MAEITGAAAEPRLPRITIQFCTQCKWMLRAAYYAQELLSTFSTALGEVALQPATGGVFVVEMTVPATDPQPSDRRAEGEAAPDKNTAEALSATTTAAAPQQQQRQQQQPRAAAAAVVHRIWDRRVDGGFPETKELKRRVRDVIQPGRDLGHVDRDYGKGKKGEDKGVHGGEGDDAKKGGKEGDGGDKGMACDVAAAGKCEDCE